MGSNLEKALNSIRVNLTLMRVEPKGRAIKIVADHLRELAYKQRMRHIISAQRIAALVGLLTAELEDHQLLLFYSASIFIPLKQMILHR